VTPRGVSALRRGTTLRRTSTRIRVQRNHFRSRLARHRRYPLPESPRTRFGL